MRQNFEHFWKFLRFWEKDYVCDPKDPGGLTIFGLSMRSHPGLVTELDRLWKEGKKEVVTAKAIQATKQLYWDAVKADELPSGVDLVAADTAFLQGISVAQKVLKESVIDCYKLFQNNKESLFLIMIIKRFDYLDDIRPTLYERFGRGWSKRIISLYDFIVSGFQEIKYD